QPYIHDIIVTIFYNKKQYKFCIFFQRHLYLPSNQCVAGVNGAPIAGDLLVVACGKRYDVQNMNGLAETQAADLAARRYM
ncbi:hypothetical protein GYMLUDRAFT_122538, partial [Collybiopsis luxurians FD-317 M1]